MDDTAGVIARPALGESSSEKSRGGGVSSRVMDPALADRLAAIVLDNLATAWPYHVIAMVRSPDEAIAPAARTPMFASCYDWHSSVHNHWALIRLAPWLGAARREAAARALAASLTFERAAVEERHLIANPGFERPYGLAWLVALAAAAPPRVTDPTGAAVAAAPIAATRAALAGLARVARERLVAWADGLAAPIRSGEHSQSMFAMALALDAARATGHDDAAARLATAARRLHDGDRDAPWHWEPSAYDFLSPGLAVAWLMLRVYERADFAAWLDRYAPGLGRDQVPAPVTAVDRGDGKLVHWDGLNLSRAWMLAAIGGALPPGDDRRAALVAAGADHLARGVAALDGATYAGRHWLPSFAVYALLQQGEP
jgi:Protein of unknown function (DUF2891)